MQRLTLTIYIGKTVENFDEKRQNKNTYPIKDQVEEMADTK